MTTINISPSSLSDTDLLSTTRLAAEDERSATARLIGLLAEVDTRRLYLAEGYSSMFAWCTRALHISEHAAYARIEAARVARRVPGILERLADGRLSLTTVGLLAPHLSDENGETLLEAAERKSKREVEHLIASIHPQPDIPASVRALPTRVHAVASSPDLTMLPTESGDVDPASTAAIDRSKEARIVTATAASRPVIAPLASRRYLLRVTMGEETHRKLERARDLLRHEVPDGDPAALIDRALTLLVAHAERTKFAATTRTPASRVGTSRARQRSRRIPAAVRRTVWARDQGRCVFKGRDGRCDETGFLEFHHVVPFAAGGPSTVENLELRCRAHNEYEAEGAGLTLWRDSKGSSGQRR
jgi:5-methylcytosine-specific restriction endonuclease McrA